MSLLFPDMDRVKRIRECVKYAHNAKQKDERPLSFSTFDVPRTNPPSEELTMLRHAAASGLAELVSETPECISYSIATPVQPGNDQEINPQWWAGRSEGGIRAGPLGTDSEVTKMQGVADKEKARKERSRTHPSGRLYREELMAREGLRRQEKDLPMSDDAEREPSPSDHEDASDEGVWKKIDRGGKGEGWIAKGERLDRDIDED
ncbi:hypothetical protein BS50DRAFT_630942 [Corynespora cassiicola Philippines]|uniref:Uncharacterized protein n=1 Tax=Corynespora cassiicola Philippines TaxID=1448308 RepID=A0A2T2NZN3_CORCC|nr:hypothetical protein BS50DRAFT_630942 [Corynespora cassiicola Philippines]